MNKAELELKLEKQCKRLCKVTNEFNQLRANIELTKKQIAESKE
jgi:archaellum component FlaC